MHKDEFIKSAILVHNDVYSYDSLEDNVDIYSNITITCKIHGAVTIRARNLLNGSKCPKCAGKYMRTYTDVIEECKIKHNNQFTYNSMSYINLNSLLSINCSKHGMFYMTAKNHLNGQGCKKCKRNEKTYDGWINECKIKHSNKYKYIKHDDYVNCNSKVTIICPEHGEFVNQIHKHLISVTGCPKCSLIKNAKDKTKDSHTVINYCKNVHNNLYTYDDNYDDYYEHTRSKIGINCSKHGRFTMTANSHMMGQGCPRCSTNSVSKAETNVGNWLAEYVDIKRNSRKHLIDRLELDIVVPEHNLAIEYNGVYWHRENDNKLLHKLNLCNERGIRLLHIFEDEWFCKQDIVKSRILNNLKMSSRKLFARKTTVDYVDSKVAKEFLETNHIQGSTPARIKIGLFYNDELVALMTFGKQRIALGRKAGDKDFELLRFCNALNTNVVGGASKLLQFFVKHIEFNSLISYADKRWSDGNLYRALNFTEVRHTAPNYFWTKYGVRHHRYKFAKWKLVKDGYDATKTENDIMYERGFYKVYDCGNILFEYNKQ